MSHYYGGWAPCVSVAERRKKAAREVKKLRKKGHIVAPIEIEGRKITTTFWGKSWCDNLESYHDFENRLPRGRNHPFRCLQGCGVVRDSSKNDWRVRSDRKVRT